MKRRFHRLALTLLAALLAPLALHAEDIDLFVDAPASTAGNGLPNVLIVLDNTANWNTPFTNEMAALNTVLQNLPPDKFNIGLLMSFETGGGNSNVAGGYIRAAIRQMSASNLTLYRNLFQSIDKNADKSNGGASSLMMAEAYYYFAGKAPYAGNNKVKTDYTGNVSGSSAQSKAIWALSGNALSSISATRYNSPVVDGSCAKNFIIYISNGPNQESNARSTDANTLLAAEGGDTTQIAISPTGSQTNPSDEWARFMRDKSPLGIVTFTLDIDRVTNGQGPGWTALLKSMAGDPKRYRDVSSAVSADIVSALNDYLTTIQAVNTVFASVSLPVNLSQQGYYLNQVYVGMFRPDSEALPRWFGNLKQYRMGMTTTDLRLQDADGRGAINSQTGFLEECTRSFWTPTITDTYWSYSPRGGCIRSTTALTAAAKASNTPDGNMVEKGGQAYVLRDAYTSTGAAKNPGTRNLKTCSTTFASCTSLVAFDSTTATQTALGAASTTERDAIISWTKGLDVDDENSNGVTGSTSPSFENRPSMHGDVIHSQPVAINFGTQASPKVVVFYGSNDGAFRAINGNRTADLATGVAAGSEFWSFMPPEFFPNLKRLRDNTVQIKFPNVTDASAKPKGYGMDGPVSAYVTSSSAWVYAGMRRGGRALYAFDVNTTTPTTISLKWKRGCPNLTDDTNCGTGFTGIGQTWSAPKPFKAAGYSGTLLVMGGGYDKCEDTDPHTCTASSKGRYVYVMDADTGTLLATFTTTRGVIADVAVLPDANTGNAKFLYVADLGGNVYRIDTRSGAPTGWAMTRIASLGCADVNTCTNNRKFMFRPDVTEYGGDNIVLLGSGDREKPLDYASPAVVNSIQNKFFMLRDRPDDATWLTNEATNCTQSVLCLNSLVAIAYNGSDPTSVALAAKKGWALDMRAKEQVVTTSITIFGTVTFSTHQPKSPTAGQCTANLGQARVYNVSYSNASPTKLSRSSDLPPVGLPPSPVAGMVTLDDGKTVPFCIGCDASSPLEATQPPYPASALPSEPKRRVYWFIQH